MLLTAATPCHKATTTLNVSARGTTEKLDRKCPVCGCWWRADTRFVREEQGRQYHAVDWTRVGHIST